jgi:hypothetical protein
MKPSLLLSALCLIVTGNSANSVYDGPAHRSASPSVLLSPAAIASFSGPGSYSNPNGELNCFSLLSQHSAYQDGQINAPCNEAEISCVRYGLTQQFAMNPRDGQRVSSKTLQEGLALGLADVKLKLLGCALAIEAATSRSQPTTNQSGFVVSPIAMPSYSFPSSR